MCIIDDAATTLGGVSIKTDTNQAPLSSIHATMQSTACPALRKQPDNLHTSTGQQHILYNNNFCWSVVVVVVHHTTVQHSRQWYTHLSRPICPPLLEPLGVRPVAMYLWHMQQTTAAAAGALGPFDQHAVPCCPVDTTVTPRMHTHARTLYTHIHVHTHRHPATSQATCFRLATLMLSPKKPTHRQQRMHIELHTACCCSSRCLAGRQDTPAAASAADRMQLSTARHGTT